jgi:transposase
MNEGFGWLAPAALWPRAQQVLPPAPVRPQGGGAQRLDERAVFAAVAFVLVTGTPWRALPRVFGVSWQNVHRRFLQWSRAEVWQRLVESTSDTPDAFWATELERAALARLREPAQDPAAAPPAGQEWRKPVVRRVQRNLVERLFGRPSEPPAGEPAPPSGSAATER